MLITPFVMREKGLNKIPDVTDLPPTVEISKTKAGISFLFNYHKHHLSLVSELSDKSEEDDCEKVMGEEDEDDASNNGLKICDVCITPISSPPYYECAACRYFVHSICSLLPKSLSTSSPHLSSSCPGTHDKNHKFTLYTSLKWMDVDDSQFFCALCGFITNGMVYACEGCKMKIDIKCASIPTTIRHAFHPHHKRLILTRISPQDEGGKGKTCHGCDINMDIGYCCSNDDCDFALDLDCAMLPASITKHEWDHRPLLLSCDASFDHPSDFVCDYCEVELNPKWWMHHCRQCDLSFHLFCLRTASGGFRNIKFGRPFVFDVVHPHPLTYNCVTIKKRCDICCTSLYDDLGLECASCNYVVCKSCALMKFLSKNFSFPYCIESNL